MLAVGLALPAIVAVLFGLCVGGNPRGLHLAVVNDDFHCGDGVPDFPNDCDSQDMTGLSCRYLGSLDKDTFIVVRSSGSRVAMLSKIRITKKITEIDLIP